MKKIVILLFLGSSIFTFAQNDEGLKEVENVANTVESADSLKGEEKKWNGSGTFTFLVNQSSFNNWLAGGENNIAGNASVNYDLNYKSGKWIWDNKFIASYGLTKIENQDARKTDDRLEINSMLGREAWSENWLYSFFINFRTQFTDGFDYDNDANEDFRTTGLFAPAYLTFGPGLAYRKSDNFKVNIAPLTSKMTFISGDVYENRDGVWVSNTTTNLFGVDPGESLRYELGLYVSAYYKFDLMKNVSWENTLNLYSNYLEDPQNVDIDYTANIVMQINKYLSTNFTYQAIYDDNAFRGFQTRQVIGLGLNYTF